MEKLLRYLNIYAHSFMNCNLTFIYDGNRIRVQWDEIWPYVAESIVINKKFWFIEWLIENDKLDVDRLDKRYTEKAVHFVFINEQWTFEHTDRVDLVIARLSISENPISDLCSFIK